MSAILIRRMTAADVPGVRHVARVTWAATYEGIIPATVQEQFLDEAYAEAQLLRRMAGGIMLVAARDEAIVGFANFWRHAPDEAELTAIYVLPAAQGAGIGTRFVRAGLAELPGVTRLRLSVDRDNLRGRRFYTARGFVVVGERIERLAGHDLPLVEMMLECAGQPWLR